MSDDPETMRHRIASIIHEHRYVQEPYAIARMILEALREPTDEMIQAAYDAVNLDDRWHIEDEDHWKKAWAAAVDAATDSAGGANG